jgi:hypothetical protein
VTTHLPTAISYATRRDYMCRRLICFLGVKQLLNGHAAYPNQVRTCAHHVRWTAWMERN